MLDSQHKLTQQGRVNELEQESMKKRYGTFWLNSDSTRIGALTYQLLFYVRRFILAYLIAFVDDVSMQLIVLSLVSLLLVIFHILVQPMDTQVNRRIELANEIIIYTAICT